MSLDLWSWILAALGIAQLIMTGRLMRSGWIVGLITSITWATFALVTGAYGFLVSSAVFASIHIYNWRKWAPVTPTPALKDATLPAPTPSQ